MKSSHDPLYVVYAHVFDQLFEDLEHCGTTAQASALKWFCEELLEVAIVSAICEREPVCVYRAVARRLRQAKIKSRAITLIRLQLRRGQKLSEITVPLTESSLA